MFAGFVMHRYVAFRLRLAQHGLSQFFARFCGGAEIVALVFANVLLGLFALIALPPMYAASLPLPRSIPLLAAHGLAMSVPMWLLRQRLLPLDVVQWQHRLPLPRKIALAADALVAAMLAGPLALAYLVSAAIWLYQQPAWLRPAPAIAGILFSLVLTWACSLAVLSLRARRRTSRLRGPRPAAPSLVASTLRPRTLLLWHRLFWLPFWRADNSIGRRQALLLLGAIGSGAAWTLGLPGVPRPVLGLCFSVLLVLLAERGDQAVRDQIAYLSRVMTAWPLARRPLLPWARAGALAPGLLVLALLFAAGGAAGAWDRIAGRVFLVLACMVQMLLVGIPRFSGRGRVALVVGAILVLSAVGSEIWN